MLQETKIRVFKFIVIKFEVIYFLEKKCSKSNLCTNKVWQLEMNTIIEFILNYGN